MTAIEVQHIEAVERVLLRAADELGRAKAREMELEMQRALVKLDAIRRLVGTPNDLNGKPHSASSAEAAVETDHEYMQHRAEQREAVIHTLMCAARYESAKVWERVAGRDE